MSQPKKFRFSLVLFLLAVSTMVCLIAIGTIFLPSIAESLILSQIGGRFGPESFSCNIRGIQLDGADLGPVRLGPAGRPGIAVDTLRIVYSPHRLFQGRVDGLAISGARVFLSYENGLLSIRGVDLNKLSAALRLPFPVDPDGGPVAGTAWVGQVEISDTILWFQWGERMFRMPLEVRVTAPDKHADVFKFRSTAYLFGGKIDASGTLDLNAGTAMISVRGEALESAKLAGLAPVPEGSLFSGKIDIGGRAECQIKPFKLSSFSAAIDYHQPRIHLGGFTFSNFRTGETGGDPFRIEVKQTSDGNWDLALLNGVLTTPIPARFDTVKCRLTIGADVTECRGNYTMNIDPVFQKQTESPATAEEMLFRGRFGMNWTETGQWEFMVGGNPYLHDAPIRKDFRFVYKGLELFATLPEFSVSGSGSRETATVDFQMALPPTRARMQKKRLSTGMIRLKGVSKLDLMDDSADIRSEFKLSADGIELEMGPVKGRISEIKMEGNVNGNTTGINTLETHLKFSNADVSNPKVNLRFKGINGQIPLRWPYTPNLPQGSISVSEIHWRDRFLGRLNAMVRQNGSGLQFDGSHTSQEVKGLMFHFSGNLDKLPTEEITAAIDFTIPRFRPSPPLDLGRFVSSLGGFQADGDMGASGTCGFRRSDTTCSLQAQFHETTISSEERDLFIEGMNVTVSFPDLLNATSGPGQQLRFKNARLGDLKIENGKVEFQLESDRSLFIENGSFDWCRGRVDAQGMRIIPGRDDYRMVLYGDRLMLSDILEQFGAVQAEGSGTLNGKIPVRYTNGRLTFNDGFLYSTPGEGGTVKLVGTEVLTTGIPKNTVEYGQLELAREALKDYNYKWVKLSLNTQNDTLLLRMQMDGKPAKPLPFAYDPKFGGFVRTESGSKGSIFQGISLDVNFKLPLDDILSFKNILNRWE